MHALENVPAQAEPRSVHSKQPENEIRRELAARKRLHGDSSSFPTAWQCGKVGSAAGPKSHCAKVLKTSDYFAKANNVGKEGENSIHDTPELWVCKTRKRNAIHFAPMGKELKPWMDLGVDKP